MDKKPLILTNTQDILDLLSRVTLKGNGFVTESLVADLLDAGLSEPDYLNASGADPLAYYDDQPNAWANYHVRQSKKVLMVYGGENRHRTLHIADTP